MTPLWAVELAAKFWREAGSVEPFPRRLREPLDASPFLVTVEELPHLTTQKVELHLATLGCPRRCGAPSRELRGCLVAAGDSAWLFLDTNDDPAERTATLAHELAHYLRDYWQPRERARSIHGPAALEVLDGRRPPRPAERLQALFHNAPLAAHVHLMARHADYLDPAIRAAEEAADCLALELLAPADEVLHRLAGSQDRATARGLLQHDFALPPSLVEVYLRRLFPEVEPSPLLLRLRNAWQNCRTSPGSGEEEAGGSSDVQH